MAEHDKIPPAGLHPRLVKKLLDSLESDASFRTTFQESPEKALRSLGYTDPWECMQLSSSATLASPDLIRTQRAKLEDSLVNIQGQTCPLEVQEGL
jgi:putative modified peptide